MTLKQWKSWIKIEIKIKSHQDSSSRKSSKRDKQTQQSLKQERNPRYKAKSEIIVSLEDLKHSDTSLEYYKSNKESWYFKSTTQSSPELSLKNSGLNLDDISGIIYYMLSLTYQNKVLHLIILLSFGQLLAIIIVVKVPKLKIFY